VKTGIGIHEQASIDMPGIKGLWSLSQPADREQCLRYDKFLVQSYTWETRILSIDGEEMSETNIAGFSSTSPTLYCGNMAGEMFAQVTPMGVRLVDSDSLQLLQEFVVSSKAIVATGNMYQLSLALAGGKIMCLEVDKTSRTLVMTSEISLDHDAACFSLGRPHSIDLPSAAELTHESSVASSHPEGKSSLLVVGMWTDNSVRVLTLPGLEEVTRVHLGKESAQIRGVALAPLSPPSLSNFTEDEGAFEIPDRTVMHLLVGLGDGTLITFVMNISSGLPVLSDRHDISLGTHPISFSCFANDGAQCVFASCDRPTVIYSRSNNDQLLFSALNINDEITSMAPFNSPLFPNCLAMSSESGLLIGNIDSLQKIHFQSYPLGQAPRQICHHKSTSTLVVCCSRIDSTPRGEESSERILFLDDRTMDVQYTFELDTSECGMSCLSCVLTDSQSNQSDATPSREYVVVGTAFVLPEEQQPTRGRILVFEVSSERNVTLSAESVTKGATFSLASLNGRLVAGIDSKVQLFRYSSCGEDGSGVPELIVEFGHHGHVLALYVKTKGDYIVVGDLLRSVCLLHYKASDGTLEEVARDFSSNYMRAVDIINNEYCIGSEDHGNIFVLKRNLDAKTEEEKGRLDMQSGFHLGDFINVFRQGSLSSSFLNHKNDSSSTPDIGVCDGGTVAKSVVPNSVLFGTVSGVIGTVLSLSSEDFRFLSALEKSMNHVAKGVGDLVHKDWREFFHERRQSRRSNTIDGDLIEMFLDLNETAMKQVTKFVNDEMNHTLANEKSNVSSTSAPLECKLSVGDIVQKVEDLVRMH